jgi:hypothetical protein
MRIEQHGNTTPTAPANLVAIALVLNVVSGGFATKQDDTPIETG